VCRACRRKDFQAPAYGNNDQARRARLSDYSGVGCPLETFRSSREAPGLVGPQKLVSRVCTETTETVLFGTVNTDVELDSLQTDTSFPLLTLMRTTIAATPRPEVQSRQ
jgi:hypothetical protein